MAAADLAWPAKAAAAPRLLQYTAVHARYGAIGVYSNLIDRTADQTVVTNEVHLLVKILGIVLHRENAQRTERWSGDRLVAFQGVTTVNGEAATVSGKASDAGFVITTASGSITAPSDIRPSNPWSAGFLASRTLLRTDNGTIEQVTVGAPKNAPLTIGNVPLITRVYDVAATSSYRVWLDPQDVPVRFSVNDDSGLVTFTLTNRA